MPTTDGDDVKRCHPVVVHTSREMTNTMVLLTRRVMPYLVPYYCMIFKQMATMWEVRSSGGRGRELFGVEYNDVWGIGTLHFTAAGQAECDHVSKLLPSNAKRGVTERSF